MREGSGMAVSGTEPDLSWLADAPVFIDGRQIGAFYDAVVGREFRTVQVQLSAGQAEQLERSAGGSVNGGSSALFAWLRIDAGAEARRTRSRGRQAGQSIALEPVESPSMPDQGSRPVAYPADDTTDDGTRQRDAHWKWYADHWHADEVVNVVEEVIGDGGRPRWIDYKMIFATGEALDLHVDAHGDYDTGVFAYNLIGAGGGTGSGSSAA
ncbi:MAG: hypothetical protein J2P25_12575 [Nocardiopsaceae bacterium]|nr:hypothetical protein [Nocardiopsaceae bacterium]